MLSQSNLICDYWFAGAKTMNASELAAKVERIVQQTFQELATTDVVDDVCETILVRDGKQFARSYRLDDLIAMWIIEDGVIRFYDATMNECHIVNLFDDSKQLLAA
jgi:hypothetical protein